MLFHEKRFSVLLLEHSKLFFFRFFIGNDALFLNATQLYWFGCQQLRDFPLSARIRWNILPKMWTFLCNSLQQVNYCLHCVFCGIFLLVVLCSCGANNLRFYFWLGVGGK